MIGKTNRQTHGFFFSKRQKSVIFGLISLFFVIGFFVLVFPFPVHAETSFLNSPTQWVGEKIDNGLKAAAMAVFNVLGTAATVAGSILMVVLDPKNITGVMQGPDAAPLYEVWMMVRDFLNLFFILILLLSAFATIFQVDKYHYKKILLNLVIMALLVNFSWPISRFVVDIANSMTYFFLDSAFAPTTAQQLGNSFIGAFDIGKTLLPIASRDSAGWEAIILAIIVMFLVAITFLILALMMLVRLIALPILVMFSPIGFVANIVPGAEGYAKEWWHALFRYAFYGPITVFMLLVAMKYMSALNYVVPAIQTVATNNTSDAMGQPIVMGLVKLAIPVVLFWIVILQGEKMTSKLAFAQVKFGSNMGKWAGNTFIKRPAYGLAKMPVRAAKATGIPGGVSQAWKNRKAWWTGAAFSEKNTTLGRERREAKISGGLSGGKPGWNAAADRFESKKVMEKVDEHKKLNTNRTTLLNDLKGSNKTNAKAAALYLAEKELLTNEDDLAKALDVVGSDYAAAKQIISKAPKNITSSAKGLTTAVASLRKGGHDKLIKDLIDKAGKDSLGSNETEYGDVLKSFDGLSNKDELVKAYKSRVRDEGKMNIQVNWEQKENGGDRAAAIQKTFANIKAEDMAKQSDDLLIEKEFTDYMKSQSNSRRKETMAQFGRSGKDAVAKHWEANGIAPTPTGKRKKGGAGTP